MVVPKYGREEMFGSGRLAVQGGFVSVRCLGFHLTTESLTIWTYCELLASAGGHLKLQVASSSVLEAVPGDIRSST